MDIELFGIERLGAISSVFTSSKYLRVFGIDEERTFIHCPDVFIPDKMSVDIVQANGFSRGYAVFPKEGFNIVYLACILNSVISWAYMTGQRLDRRLPISLGRLLTVPIRILPPTEQDSVAYLHIFLLTLQKNPEDDSNELIRNFWKSIYNEILNAISFELVMPSLFKEYEIDVCSSWCSLIESYRLASTSDNEIGLRSFVEGELLTPHNAVIGNLQKLRVVMKQVLEQVEENV